MLDVKIVRKRQTNYPQVFKAINRNFLPKAGTIVLSEAQRRVPVGRDGGGILRGSLRFRVSGDQVAVGTNIEYAPYVEFGTGIHAEGGKGRKTPWVYFSDKFGFVKTSGMKAQPYLRPALDVNRKKLVKLWANTYSRVFRVLGGK